MNINKVITLEQSAPCLHTSLHSTEVHVIGADNLAALANRVPVDSHHALAVI